MCSHDPRQFAKTPMGMYHCPECGEMVIAGCPHPVYKPHPLPCGSDGYYGGCEVCYGIVTGCRLYGNSVTDVDRHGDW